MGYPGQPYPDQPYPGQPYPGQPYPGQPAGPFDPASAQQVPGGPWHVPAYLNPDDPLITPPHAGFDGWFKRVTGTLRRSWRPLVAVLALTHLLPGMILGGILLAYFGTSTLGMGSGPVSDAEVGEFFGVVVLVLIVGAVLTTLSQAVGYAATGWIITREAMGEPAPVGEALRFGVRRMFGLWGWTLLYGLVVGFGLCLCVLPGLYFGFALALFGPVYVFERQNPFGRAWRMFHDNFGPVLGRLAILAAAVVAVQVVVSLFQNIGLAVSGGSTLESGADLAITMVFTLVGYVALLPATMLQASGLVVTYAEQRARQGPLTTATLASELAYEPA